MHPYRRQAMHDPVRLSRMLNNNIRLTTLERPQDSPLTVLCAVIGVALTVGLTLYWVMT